MTLLGGPWNDWSVKGRTAVSLGVFDGVHRGHRSLIQVLNPETTSVILTFDPHPVEVLNPDISPRLLTTLDERADLLAGAGVQCIGVLDLRTIRHLAPDEFVESLLVDRLALGQLVVGPDFRFGKDRAGDVNLLLALGEKHGFEVHVAEFLIDDDGVISSSRLRNLVEAGDVAAAAEAMESRFCLTGPVAHGDKRGRDLGFPTANLLPVPRKAVPGHGVYAAFAHVSSGAYQAAVNVGVRPTFGGSRLLIEAHLLDFDDDIYGEALTLELVEQIRPELRFEHVSALIDAMHGDVSSARETLASLRPSVRRRARQM